MKTGKFISDMWKKRLLIGSSVGIVVALIVTGLFFARQALRKMALNSAAQKLSSSFFDGAQFEIDYKNRSVVFNGPKAELQRKYNLTGRTVFKFPVKFWELPWRPRLGAVEIHDVTWDLNLAKKSLNGQQWYDFLNDIQNDLNTFSSDEHKTFPDFITYGKLRLTNPAGKVREQPIRSIYKKNKDNSLLGVYSNDIKINFFYNAENKKLIGQYQAAQEDFEFVRMSFGLPELFDFHGSSLLSGQFQYDIPGKNLDYIRGSCAFGPQDSIKGAVVMIFGNRDGKLNWEYLNPQNWQIEVRNASSTLPFRSKLHYFVLSQNTMEKDSVNFDGEIEFNHNTFKNMFNLELDMRTAMIRHRLVGKWNLSENKWELSRLDAGKKIPQVKVKWNGYNIALQGQTFKLSGSGADKDHLDFHYLLEMTNADIKDREGNALIGAQLKLEGDCSISLTGDTLKPLLSSRLTCQVADGIYDNTKFMLKNIDMSFFSDKNDTIGVKFSTGETKLGIPDLKKGLQFELPHLAGEISSARLKIGSDSLKIKYEDFLALETRKRWSINRSGNDRKIIFYTSGLTGKVDGKDFSARNIRGELSSLLTMWKLDYSINNINWKKHLVADKINGVLEGVPGAIGKLDYRKFTLDSKALRFHYDKMGFSAPSFLFKINFDEKRNVKAWDFYSGQSAFRVSGREYVMPQLSLSEVSKGDYNDGIFKCSGIPYRFDLAYTRRKSENQLDVKHGRIEGGNEVLWGVTGSIKFLLDNEFLNADLKYAEFKERNNIWENGALKIKGAIDKGIFIAGFNGNLKNDITFIEYAGKNKRGENIFNIRNLQGKYVENTLRLAAGTVQGLFDGRVTIARDVFFNPFKIQTFYLKNNPKSGGRPRINLRSIEHLAKKGNSIEDQFACDALKDFFANSLEFEYKRVRLHKEFEVKVVGKSADLLPYEYDVKNGKLKKIKEPLFNSEVEIIMKYIMN